MDKDITLLVLAAGMGSRFGGLKQIEPMGPNGEFIIDYSVYDAIKAGFTKVVFIITEENYDVFKDTIGSRVDDKIKVEYAFQKNDNLPEGYEVPENRVKPLGTAHAILCCKENVHEPFMIINADDFYGEDAFKKSFEFLKTAKNSEFGMIGYRAQNTLTENGTVSRGICEIENGILTSVTERTKIIDCKFTEDDGATWEPLAEDTVVSMNLWGFTPDIFEHLELFLFLVLDNLNNQFLLQFHILYRL